MNGVVMKMKRLISLFIVFLIGQCAFAAQGGKHNKDQMYDYHDYVNNDIESKRFYRYQRDDFGFLDVVYEEVWNFDRSNPPKVVRTEITTDVAAEPDIVVRYVDNTYQPTSTSFDWVQLIRYDPRSYPAKYPEINRDYDPPVNLMTSTMFPGIAWGTAGVILNTPSPNGYFVDKNEILAIEDVTVPAGTFSDCLKLHKLRQYGNSSNTPYARIEWICPGMGIVKRLHGGFYMLELVSTLPPIY